MKYLNIAIFALVAALAAASCPTHIEPVCHDGITFQNSCLTEAQGVFNYQPGKCPDKLMPHFVEGPESSEEELKFFAPDGFLFAGRVNTTESNHQEEDQHNEPGYNKFDEQYAIDADEAEDQRLTRVTVAGSMYMANEFKPAFEEEYMEQTRSRMLRARKKEDAKVDDFGRKLSVFLDGSDDRVQIGSPYGPDAENPDDFVGELLYSAHGLWYQPEGCTATVIGRNKILTAAHCVYNAERGAYTMPTEFVLRRYRTENTCSGPRPWSRGCEDRRIDPYGKWPVLFATIHSAYTSPPNVWGWPWDHVPYDVAVINLGPQEYGDPETDIGPTLGSHMFVRAAPFACSPGADPSINYGTIGYPVDKPDSSLWLSNACDFRYRPSCSSNWIFHDCDVTVGMDGGPFYLPNQTNPCPDLYYVPEDPDVRNICLYEADWPYYVFGVQGEPRREGRSTYFDDGFHSNVGYAFNEQTARSVPRWGNWIFVPIPSWPGWPLLP